MITIEMHSGWLLNLLTSFSFFINIFAYSFRVKIVHSFNDPKDKSIVLYNKHNDENDMRKRVSEQTAIKKIFFFFSENSRIDMFQKYSSYNRTV